MWLLNGWYTTNVKCAFRFVIVSYKKYFFNFGLIVYSIVRSEKRRIYASLN